MLLGLGFCDCSVNVSESLFRIAKAEMRKTEERKTHGVRINTGLLNKITVEIADVKMVDFAKMRAGRTKIPAQQSCTPPA